MVKSGNNGFGYFLFQVLDTAICQGAKKIRFENHRAPVVAVIEGERGRIEYYHWGDGSLSLTLAKLLNIKKGELLHLRAPNGSIARYSMSYAGYPDFIDLTSVC